MAKSKYVILIHGNFVNNRTWENWKPRFESRGYAVHTPANPGHDGDPAELRDRVHPDLGSTGLKDVVRNIERLIDTLPEKPLVVGHSMAGVAAKKLVEMERVAAAVSIHGAPPKNVFPAPIQTLKTVFPSFGVFSPRKTWLGSQGWYAKAFFNTLPEGARSTAYETYAVPESCKVNRDLVLDSFAKVDFKRPHVPMLFIGGGSDNIFSSHFTERIAGRYTDSNSRLDVRTFDNRSHFTCGEPGWEEVADYVLDWYENL